MPWALNHRAPRRPFDQGVPVGEQLNPHNLPARHREAEDHTRPPARSPHQTHLPVNECHLGDPRTTGESLGDFRRTTDFFCRAHLHGDRIGPQHDLGIEQCQKSTEIATSRSGQKRLDHMLLTIAILSGCLGSLHPPATRGSGKPRRAGDALVHPPHPPRSQSIIPLTNGPKPM